MEEAKDPEKEARMSAFWTAVQEVAKERGMELSCVMTFKDSGIAPAFRITEVPKSDDKE